MATAPGGFNPLSMLGSMPSISPSSSSSSRSAANFGAGSFAVYGGGAGGGGLNALAASAGGVLPWLLVGALVIGGAVWLSRSR